MIFERTTPQRKPAFGTMALDPGHPLARGLMGYWLTNEGAGQRVLDLTGRNVMGVSSSGAVTWGASRRGVVPTLPGDYFPVVSPASELAAGPISAAAFVYPTVDDYANWIGHNGNAGWRCRMDAGRTVTLLDRGGTHVLSTSATIPLNAWSRLTIVMTASGCAIYINGVLSTSDGTAFGGGSSSASELALGGQGTGNTAEAWRGPLDSIRYWFRGLTAGEVAWDAAEPYGMLRPILRRRFFLPPTAEVPISGTLTVTLAAMTAIATGAVALAGAATITLGPMTLISTGGAPTLAGSLTGVFGALLALGTGRVTITGAVGGRPLLDENGEPILDEDGNPVLDGDPAPLGAMTLAATGAVAAGGTTGLTAATLGAMIAAATATVSVRGLASITLGATTLTSVGGAGIGGLTATFDPLTLIATGTVLPGEVVPEVVPVYRPAALPDLRIPFSIFGQPATIALRDDHPDLPFGPEQTVTAVWLPAPSSALPPGVDVNAVEPRHRLAFRRAEVPTLRQGSIIKVASVSGGPAKTWRVDVIDEASAEEIRVLVLPVEPQFP
jgi:hypothetical protein